jgi:basic membrane protein A and related proteins
LCKGVRFYLLFLMFSISLQVAAEVKADMTVGLLTGPGGLGDESFNDMTYKGLGKVGKKFGLNIVVRECREPDLVEKLFLEIIDEGVEIIVLNGGQFFPLVQRYATVYPHIRMIANDFHAGDFSNVKSILYNHGEGAFLAGVLAGSVSSKGRIGFIGAHDIEVIHVFKEGFRKGIEYVSPQIDFQVQFIAKELDYSGFSSPEKAYDIANSLYESGVDIIFAVAGMSGNGVIRAAKQNNKYVIGVDSDQDHMAKGNVLTSVMKRLDIAIYNEIHQVMEGQFIPGVAWYGLGNEGIGLTPMKYTRDIIGETTLESLREIKRQIIAGKIHVPTRKNVQGNKPDKIKE